MDRPVYVHFGRNGQHARRSQTELCQLYKRPKGGGALGHVLVIKIKKYP